MDYALNNKIPPESVLLFWGSIICLINMIWLEQFWKDMLKNVHKFNYKFL